MFALARRRTRESVLAVPVLWTFIGSYAAFRLGIAEDLALLFAGAAGAWMIFRNRPANAEMAAPEFVSV
jgi:hypothetical protein